MGGKKKEAQRTKGNVKPASSGHAAQLLEASGGFHTGFVGFDSLSGDLGYVPASVQSQEAAECGDGELRMVMKRLTKRDAVTKLKALQNFNEICQDREEDIVVDALKYWPRLYSKLAIDYDHRVREAAHKALKEVATRSGRNLAPHLKHLIGAWMLSLCDQYAPAASAARSAFNAVFTTDVKQSDAIVYCHSELIKFVSDMLFTATPQSLSDAKVTPPEEMLEKYERILSASLLSLRLVIKMCPAEKLSNLSERCSTILEHSAFWKFANHENRTVKSSFFSLLASIVSDLPALANDKAAKICSTVLSRMGETDPVVCPNLWDAVENVTSIENFWKHVNIRKAMLPSLWSSLQKGFDGNAAVAATKLSTIIKRLPADVTGSAREFYSLFFTHLRAGLSLDKVQRSSKEMNSLVQAYTQCVQFVVEQSVMDGDISMLEEVLENQLFVTLEEALLQPEKGLVKSCLFDEFTKFVVSLGSRMESLKSPSRDAECYSCARDMCWEKLKSLSKQCIASNQSYVMPRLISLLRSLILMNYEGDTRPKGVGFGDVHAKSVNSPPTNTTTTYTLLARDQTISPHHVELERTVELVAMVCSECLAGDRKQMSNIRDALLLCELCGSFQYYEVLAECLGGTGPSDVINQCLALLEARASDWSDISRLIIIITKYVDEEMANSTLTKLTKISKLENMEILMKVVLSADWLKRSINTWLASDVFLSHVHTLRDIFTSLPLTDGDTHQVQTGVAFFQMLVAVSHPDEELFQGLCDAVQKRILSDLATLHNPDIFIIFSDCIDIMLKHDLHVDISVLISSTVQWFTTISHTQDENSRLHAIALLKKAILNSKDISCVIQPIRETLEAMGTDADKFTIICQLCCQISSALPEDFIEAIVEDVAKATDSVHLLKWLSVTAMKGQLVMDDPQWYINYTMSDVHESCPSFITHMLFASNYLKHTHRAPSSLSTSLHKHLAVAYTWVSCVLQNKDLIHTDCEKLLSADQLSNLAYWISDKDKNSKTCIELMNTSENVLDSLVLYAADDHLPKDFDGVLSSQATLYLSSFGTLTKPQFQNLNAIAHLLSAQEAAHLLDLVAACLISAELDTMNWGWNGATGLLHLAAILIHRLKEDNSCSDIVLGILDLLCDIKSGYPHMFICEKYPYFSKVVKEEHTYLLDLNISLIRFMTEVLRLCPQKMTSKQWDQLLCTLDAWVGEDECMLPENLSIYQSQLYTSSVLNAVVAAGQAMKPVSSSPSLYPKDLLSEWVELHALSIFNILLPYYVSTVEGLDSSSATVQKLYIILCISNAHLHCPSSSVLKNNLPLKLVPGSKHHLPTEYESALNHLVPLLLSPSAVVQSGSFILLNHLVSVLPPFDKEPLEDNTEGRCPPLTLISMIDHCAAQLLSLVGGARIGVDKQLDLLPHSEELLCVRGYFLTWRLLLKYLQYSNSQQMVEYSYHLKQNHYTDDLLLVLFNVLPLEKPLPGDDLFNFNMLLNLHGSFDMSEVISIASVVYYHLVKILPALVRSWYLDLEKRANSLIDRFTSKYVSPRLCKEEMEQVSVKSLLQKSENLTVKVRLASREIVATYTLEEFSIELLIVLPSNYPVGVTSVECSKKLGVATSEWRKWMLQLNTFLTYQNGSVANAINIWKDNLDKKFAGIEECYICYSVLHGTNLQLPKQQCKTCKKKFHSACLYKWFTSSQKSTCPLCRNLF